MAEYWDEDPRLARVRDLAKANDERNARPPTARVPDHYWAMVVERERQAAAEQWLQGRIRGANGRLYGF
jgi:hypothetical protein